MDNKYIHTTNDGIHTFISNTKEVSFNDLDLGYKCYITSQDFINQDLKQYPIFQNNTYYFESTLEVVPIVHVNKNDDDDMDTVILVGLNSSECSILAYDYGIAIDPSENKITSIQAIHNNKVIDTTYINNLQYDKARFVISDYGRLISHSVHKKDSDKMFEQPNITVFNTVEKSSTPTRVHFYTNNDKGITNITSNF